MSRTRPFCSDCLIYLQSGEEEIYHEDELGHDVVAVLPEPSERAAEPEGER